MNQIRTWIFTLACLFVSISTSIGQNNTSLNLKGQNQLVDGQEKYRLLVKFSANTVFDIDQGKPVLNNSGKTSLQKGSRSLIDTLTFVQAIAFTPDEKKAMRSGQRMAVPDGKFNHYMFKGLAYIAEAPSFSKEQVLMLAQEFEKLEIVEYAAIEPVATPAPPATPSLSNYQTYRFNQVSGQNNVIGIDAEYAWSIGINGQGVKVADIEWGMNYDHEDLTSTKFIELVPTSNHSYDDHGTSVAGILIAKDNGFGMKGMVTAVDKFYGISEIANGRPAGISRGLQELTAGDVFIYEMQTFGPTNAYVPADYNQAVWDITKTATDAGIIVVAAAGNGSQDLDGTAYSSYRARGDNGAIIVGAGTKSGRNTASFSTYGSPVHVQGWGDWTVATTGKGDLYNGGANATYTSEFSGTSSATPIVASAVVAVQSYSKTVNNKTLTPKQMRDLLIQTGTAAGTGGKIGPLPNIRRAIEAISTPVDYDAELSNLSRIGSDACGSTVSAQYTITNKGTKSINQITVQLYINNQLQATEQKNVNLASGQSVLASTLNVGLVSFGNISIKVVLSLPANQTDQKPTNNEQSISTTISNGSEHQVYITKASENPAITWTIKNQQGTSIASRNSSQTTTVSDLSIQKFCLADGCYSFEASDVFFTGSCNAADWSSTTIYYGDSQFGTGKGEIVAYNGKKYRAKWWTKGDLPTSGGPWEYVGDCGSGSTSGVIGVKKSTSSSSYLEFKSTDLVNNAVSSTSFCTNPILATETSATGMNEVRVYPNPFNDEFHIYLSKGDSNYQYTLVNAMGQTVQSGIVDDNSIQTKGLDRGIYFLHVINSTTDRVLSVVK